MNALLEASTSFKFLQAVAAVVGLPFQKTAKVRNRIRDKIKNSVRVSVKVRVSFYT